MSSLVLIGTEALGGLEAFARELRLIVALAAFAVLGYWTVERALGEGDDPTLRYSAGSETGRSSFLVSGVHAVALLAGVAAVVLVPELLAGNRVILGVLAAFVLAHWWFVKEERE